MTFLKHTLSEYWLELSPRSPMKEVGKLGKPRCIAHQSRLPSGNGLQERFVSVGKDKAGQGGMHFM